MVKKRKTTTKKTKKITYRSGPGRSFIENRQHTLRAVQPWVFEGMSQRTWFRRPIAWRKESYARAVKAA